MISSDKKYSRSDISALLGLGRKAKGGSWIAGVREHKGEYFIFTTVGTLGTIANEFDNRWEGNRLRWYHKKNSHVGWPSVKKLLDAGRAHVFWRSPGQDMFAYAGYAKNVAVSATTPVEILWSFDDDASDADFSEGQGIGAHQADRDNRPQHNIKVGDRIRHPDHGLGRVLAISDQYQAATAIIYFVGIDGRQELSLSEVEKVAGFGLP